MIRLLLILSVWLGLAFAAGAQTPDAENTLYLDLEYGRVVIRMRPDLAPNHVARIKHLVRGGFYDGMAFHRVLPGFVAQTGDPFGTGAGGSGRKLKAEFTRTPAVRGVVAMARGSGKDSADSQFFIVLADNRAALDGKYTVWGEVVGGMEFVDQIKKGDERRDGKVNDPDRLIQLQVAADAEGTAAPIDPAETARDFAAVEFRCSALADGSGSAGQSDMARLWAHGFLAGFYKAQGGLMFAEGSTAADDALREACKIAPQKFLLETAMDTLIKEKRALPAQTRQLAPATYTCKDYQTSQADFANLWALAFIQGFKNASQPGMEIPFDAGPRILAPFSKFCAKNPDTKFADLAALVAEKVKLQ